ncbi:exopolysaccharide biosynthesis polyprenyl glycosylphosphotransferase [Nocardioides sp. CFH 31398]|uniref:exopolysaccharide biosynthesis polyprenyl glycosylphosphotransferase n=1 Tax=Nocardioides sp. CFH 31398 TaxID=2919579 RepID=UPI001F068195|nr:exopolysaccharide biosynthesis polyprenyl glycosylphosphotransferase [Nocardioides sp. CFH 31398]MCH1867530.1 exopolysaccharide biosynthesis polyprenyl glycosylphosphotransferase [Nocardioides sp. CFH 31398]
MATSTPISTPVGPGLTDQVRRQGARLRSGSAVRRLGPALDVVAVLVVLTVEHERSGGVPVWAWSLPVIWTGLLLCAGAYRAGPEAAAVRTVGAGGAQLAVGAAVSAAVVGPAVDLRRLLLLTAAMVVLSASHRVVGGLWRSSRPVPVVLAGEPDEVGRVLVELHAATDRRWDVVGVVLPTAEPDGGFGVPVTSGFERLTAAALDSGAATVVLAPGGRLDPACLRRSAWALESAGIDLYVGTGLLDVSPSRASLVRAGGLRMLHVRPAPSRGPSRWAKEVVERLTASVVLLLALPLLVAVGVAVRRGSPGPAVYRQVRVGRDGRPFVMLKLRTMTQGADTRLAALAATNDCGDGVLFKMRSDPRVTPLGARLRRYSVDELPQLVNVLRGEMSLVGPRPALPSEVSAYDVDPTRRLAVKPGLTGLWQVSGRSDLSWDQTVRLDLAYVDNWSLGLDVTILCRTVRAVLGHRGAY